MSKHPRRKPVNDHATTSHRAKKEVVHQITDDDVIKAKEPDNAPLRAARGDDVLMSKKP